ncbi:hypothetical protein [Methanolacinia petrolearia]|uniref:hypothetical protein n=1 Tax=Methanolacinia petrolearia TaxID=54120 RepID=UPI003BA84B0F
MIKLTKNCSVSDEEFCVLLALTINIVMLFQKRGLATFDQLWDNIKDTFRQQFDLFLLKYTHSPETRREIEKEMERITVNEAIQDLHKILGINQVDESNFMQFGNKTLKEMLNETLDINIDATDATEQNLP